MTIIVPVADLRREPKELSCHDFSHDDLRDSQLLYGEGVEILQEQDNWLHIVAKEQPHGEESYKGWIHKSEVLLNPYKPNLVIHTPTAKVGDLTLSYGTYLEGDLRGNIKLADGRKAFCDPNKLRPIPISVDRAQLVREAEQFLGAPYLWGGRAATLEGLIASVDCSSLINLLYRAQGIEIPRDAHDQYLMMKPTQSPLPGDPLYMTKKERMSHVILYLGNDRFLESPETGKKVRILTWGKDLWEKEGRLHFKDRDGVYLHQYRCVV